MTIIIINNNIKHYNNTRLLEYCTVHSLCLGHSKPMLKTSFVIHVEFLRETCNNVHGV